MTRWRPLIALAATALTFATACGPGEQRGGPVNGEAGGPSAAGGALADEASVQLEAPQLEHDGVSIVLPEGWNGRVLPLDYPSAVLQAANFAFAPVGVELPLGEEDPIKAMTAEHALVTILPCGLVSFEEPARPAPGRVSLDDLTFLPAGHPRVPRGHALAHGSFEFGGRCLRIEADFGGRGPPHVLAGQVNAVLASLEA